MIHLRIFVKYKKLLSTIRWPYHVAERKDINERSNSRHTHQNSFGEVDVRRCDPHTQEPLLQGRRLRHVLRKDQ